MSDPVTFASATPRHALPLLFSGQAQKEFFVNQAHALADLLLHPAILGSADAPPVTPLEGDCWLVGPAPTGEWAGQAGHLACRQASSWLFAAPRNGMSLLDQSRGQVIRFAGSWKVASPVAAPGGGSVVDSVARTAIGGLIAALVSAGILPAA